MPSGDGQTSQCHLVMARQVNAVKSQQRPSVIEDSHNKLDYRSEINKLLTNFCNLISKTGGTDGCECTSHSRSYAVTG